MRYVLTAIVALAALFCVAAGCGPISTPEPDPGGRGCATADDCGPTTDPKCVMQCRDGQCLESCFGGVP